MVVFPKLYTFLSYQFAFKCNPNNPVNNYLRIGTKINPSSKPRGRPKQIDDSHVLEAVLGVFWEKGYAGASLSDLANAAGVSRPRLYDVFPDKEAMYLAVVDRVIGDTQAALDAALVAERSLKDELSTFFEMSIHHYLSGVKSRGCLVTSTAPAEAIESPAVQLALKRLIAALDEAFETRFRIAQERGENGAPISAAMLGRQATAVVQSLALRARGGAQIREMQEIAEAAVQLMTVNSC
ncbi:Transcriptional regulator, TetR family [Candidatus Burkholderia pumila]|uniref:Transcriptional regulator, TetR family n=1 Tax=Candidatus Burkholderia pumila TaxID=1090375 RepID=A0ABR5HKP2_9BURK|nr:Transcriptional regulator, TetR family [Candidatus Burkholderia pumila]